MQRSGVAQPRGPCVSPASFSGPNYSPCFLFAYLVVFLKSDTPQELSRVRGLSELVARSALSVKISAAVCTFFGRVFSSRALFLRNHGSIEFFRKCSRKLSSLAGTWLGRVECSRSAPQPVTRCSGKRQGGAHSPSSEAPDGLSWLLQSAQEKVQQSPGYFRDQLQAWSKPVVSLTCLLPPALLSLFFKVQSLFFKKLCRLLKVYDVCFSSFSITFLSPFSLSPPFLSLF